jgi:hypothetical protein
MDVGQWSTPMVSHGVTPTVLYILLAGGQASSNVRRPTLMLLGVARRAGALPANRLHIFSTPKHTGSFVFPLALLLIGFVAARWRCTLHRHPAPDPCLACRERCTLPWLGATRAATLVPMRQRPCRPRWWPHGALVAIERHYATKPSLRSHLCRAPTRTICPTQDPRTQANDSVLPTLPARCQQPS